MTPTARKTYRLIFAEANRDIFEAIRDGRKKVETRAASLKYRAIQPDDILNLVCGGESVEKKVIQVKIFKNIPDLLASYTVAQINPNVNSRKELEDLYHSFSGYTEKIAAFGLIAMELE